MTVAQRAFVVPDEETWVAAGANGLARRIQIAAEPSRAEVLLLPERVPNGLVNAVRAAWSQMPPGRELRTYPVSLPGVTAREALRDLADAERADDGHGEDGHGGQQEGEGGHEEAHDHEDMMAITGEPSADGLVMEDLEATAGPLGFGLPGGLLVVAKLDGDVIAACEVRQTLERHGAGGAPQPDAAVAWSVAELVAEELVAGVTPLAADRLLRIASVEVERAVSHISWLHRFCRLLGWPLVAARSDAVLRALVEIRASLPVARTAADVPYGGDEQAAPLREAAAFVSRLARDLAGSRRLARRTHELGPLSAAEAGSRDLAGPAARASGVTRDARFGDPAYAALGFEPTLEADGDARARTLVRVREAGDSLALAARALQTASSPEADDPLAHRVITTVEGPRGPLHVTVSASGLATPSAPGASAACAAAAQLAEGREWAAGLVTVASFDLSPWRVAG